MCVLLYHCSEEERPFVWIEQHTLSPDSINDTSSEDLSSTRVTFGYPRQCEGQKLITLQDILSLFGETVAWSFMFTADGSTVPSKPSPPNVTYNVLEVEGVTDKALARLRELYSGDEPVASLTIPLLGESVLLVVGYRPQSSSLENIFFAGLEDMVFACREDTQAEGVRTIEGGLSQAITFLDEPFPFGPKTCQIAQQHLKNMISVSSTQEVVAANSKNSDPLIREINDVPLGLRLMNSYRIAGKGHLLVLTSEAEGTSLYDGDKEDDVLRVPVKGSLPKWTMVGTSSHVQTPRHSLVAVAVHRGEESLYGVAFHSLSIHATTNSRHCQVEGVTVLPPGGLWVCLALACVGSSTQAIMRCEEKKIKMDLEAGIESKVGEDDHWNRRRKGTGKDKSKGEAVIGIYNYDSYACKCIAEHLSELTTLPLFKDDILIAAIDDIFAQWQLTKVTGLEICDA